MNVTILGGYGYIGSALASYFRSNGYKVWTPERGDINVFKKDLGVVYYCIGLTSDFRSKPYETIDAHIGFLRKILENSNFDKLVYLSSTRVYLGSNTTREDQPLLVRPNLPGDLYNISKIMGESLTLSSGKKCVIARLSNVVGPGIGSSNFIDSLLEEALKTRKLCFYTSSKSEKDYIWIDDAIKALFECKNDLKNRIYNIANGSNISNFDLAEIFSSAGIDVTFSPKSPSVIFPVINNERIKVDTGHTSNSCLNILENWMSVRLK